MAAKKLRLLEIRAGAPTLQGQADRRLGDPAADAQGRARARPAGGGLLPADGLRLARNSEEGGRQRDSGARIVRPSKGSRAAGPQAPDACSLTRRRLAPQDNLPPLTDVDDHDAVTTRAPDPTDHDRRRPSRPHRSRSTALRETIATDPSSEITPNSVKRRRPPLIFSVVRSRALSLTMHTPFRTRPAQPWPRGRVFGALGWPVRGR
jgi:hypothetical protein